MFYTCAMLLSDYIFEQALSVLPVHFLLFLPHFVPDTLQYYILQHIRSCDCPLVWTFSLVNLIINLSFNISELKHSLSCKCLEHLSSAFLHCEKSLWEKNELFEPQSLFFSVSLFQMEKLVQNEMFTKELFLGCL